MTYLEIVEFTEDFKISKVNAVVELIKYKASQGLNSLDFTHETIGFNEDLYRYTVNHFRNLGFKVNELPSSFKHGFYIEWE